MTSAGRSAPANHLLLLHGMFGNPAQWSTADHAAARDWNVLRPCLPLLEVQGKKKAIPQLAERMIDLMDREGVDRAVVGGNSLGGHVAVRMALQFPDRVSGLILTGSSGLFERGFEKSVPRRPTEEFIRTKMRDVFHAPGHCTAELVSDVMRLLSDMRRVMQMLRIAACAKRDNLRHELPSVKCPTLLVWGREDVITPTSAATEFEHLLPDSKLHILADCGHVPMVEQPVAFNSLLMDFLGRLARRVSPTLSNPSLQFSRA